MAAKDSTDIERFVAAQAPVYDTVLAELAAGRKQTHWMWFIFPQLRGLGRSSTAQFYGIASLDEARFLLDHATLGPRLIECTGAVLTVTGRSLNAIFGSPDDMKFCSSMTLFAAAGDAAVTVFREALRRACDGVPDARTLTLLGRKPTVAMRRLSGVAGPASLADIGPAAENTAKPPLRSLVADAQPGSDQLRRRSCLRRGA
jgi:uncharacterized protein (DUF1810 family)